MTTSLIILYKRELNRLKDEISSYSDDSILWKIDNDVKNSGGNLALHLIGNLNHFIGATLGNSEYIRQRDKEFKDKNISRGDIIDQINKLKVILENTFSSLTKEDLNKTYPINVFGKEMTTEYFLIHLYGHLNYHLGQINYHRRLLDNC
jgi:uncharacterized damage-inducible protein DinB